MPTLHPSLPQKSHECRVEVFLWIITGHPSGPRGVALYLNAAPWKYSHVDTFGLSVAWRSRLSVNLACGSSKSQRYYGKSAATPARMARKWAFNVRMARSAALRQWMCAGTSWYFTPHSNVMMHLYSALASLSIICKSTSMPRILRRYMISLYASMRCLLLRNLNDAVSIRFESQW